MGTSNKGENKKKANAHNDRRDQEISREVTVRILLQEKERTEYKFERKHAKLCYLTWLYIHNNDGKLPDDFHSFDLWSKLLTTGSNSQPTSISAGSYLRRTYPSPTFHTAVYAFNSEGGNRLDISRLVNVNTFTPLQRFLLTVPEMTRQHIKTNAHCE